MKSNIKILFFVLILLVSSSLVCASDYIEFSDRYLELKGINPDETYPHMFYYTDESGQLHEEVEEIRYSSRLYMEDIPLKFNSYTLEQYKRYIENKTFSENPYIDYSVTKIESFFDPITGETTLAEDNPYLFTKVDCTPPCNTYYGLTGFYCNNDYCYGTCVRTAGCKGNWDDIGSDSDDSSKNDNYYMESVNPVFDPEDENQYCNNDESCYTDYCYKIELIMKGGIAHLTPDPDNEMVKTKIYVEMDVDEDITYFGSYDDIIDTWGYYYPDDYGYTRTIDEDSAYIYPYNYGSVGNDQGYFDKTYGDEYFDGRIEFEREFWHIMGKSKAEFYEKRWYDADSYASSCARPDCNIDSDCTTAPKNYCKNQVCVECKEDGHCTSPDVCNSANQCVRCNTNTDCGVNGWIDNPTCSNNDVYDYDRTQTCNSPGTTSSSCSYSDSFNLRYDCGDTTNGVWSGDYCSGGNVVHSRDVYNRGCSGSAGSAACYSNIGTEVGIVDDCDYGCSAQGGVHCIVPECVVNSDCGTDSWLGDLICNADGNLWQQYRSWICVNPATESADCQENYETKLKTTCQYGCLEEGGNDRCDPNAPPIVSEFSFESYVYRTTSLDLTCKATDANGNNEITSASMYYREPFGDWVALTVVNEGESGGKVVFTADFIPEANASLGMYDFYCSVYDNKGKSGVAPTLSAEVKDYISEFTFPGVQDHITLGSPAVVGDIINFTANIYDPDSKVKMLICDDLGMDGLSCVSKQYCYDGYKNHGEFFCGYDTTDHQTDKYEWTSYAINLEGDVVTGNIGEFYVINQPIDPEIYLGPYPIWSYTGYYEDTITISFDDVLINNLNECSPDEDDFCTLPFTFSSDSGGFLHVSDLRILYALYGNEAPQLHYISNMTVNEGDLVTIIPTAYDPNGDDVYFNISEPIGDDGIWQTGEDDDGEYIISITASDGWMDDSVNIILKVLELIDPETGGTIRYKNIMIYVPAGSLPEDNFTAIEISEFDETNYLHENNLKIADKVYRFEPSGIVFDPPLQIEIEYNESEFENEDNIDAFLYKLIDEDDQVYKWIPMGAEVDTVNNLMRFNLTHFSDYAVAEILDDTTPPSITIFFPEERPYWHDYASRQAEYLVFDSMDFYPDVLVTLNGEELADGIIDFDSLTAGEYEFKVEATDEFNNTDSSSVVFSITDYTDPGTTHNIPTNWVNYDVDVTLSAEDDSGNVTTYYCVDQYGTCYPDLDGNNVFFNETGTHYLRYYSVDAAGNQENWKIVSVNIDKEKPLTMATDVEEWMKYDLNLKLEADDDLSGINKTFYKINDNEWTEGDAVVIEEDGKYNISYYSIDNAGNQEEVNVIPEFGIDTKEPETTAYFTSGWHDEDQIINFTCDDSGSGCNSTYYCITKFGATSCNKLIDNSLLISCPEDTSFIANISYQSIDYARNDEQPKGAVIKIDKKAPFIKINEPSQINYSYRENITIDFEIEEDSEIDSIATLNDVPIENGALLNLGSMGLGLYNLTINVTDSTGHFSQRTAGFRVVNLKPLVRPYPSNLDQTMRVDFSKKFDVTVMDHDSDKLIIEWYLDGDYVSNSTELTFTPDDAGEHNIVVNVSDGMNSKLKHWSLKVRDNYLINSFDGGTTPIPTMSEEEVANISNFVLEKQTNGRIEFLDRVDLRESVDFDGCVNIDNYIIGADTDCLPDLRDKPARIIVRNLAYNTTPEIYYYNGFTTEIPDTIQKCDTCTIVYYNEPPVTDGNVVFDVEHFSTFFIIFEEETTPTEEDPEPEEQPNNSSNQTTEPTPIETPVEPIVYSPEFILDLDVKVGSKTDRNLNDGDKISKKAEPGDYIVFDIELTNTFVYDWDIEDIEIEIIIEDIDDGDLMEEDYISKIRAGRKEKAEIEFEIPEIVEEGNYDVIVHVEGEDEDNKEYEIIWSLRLKVEKENHKLSFYEADLSPSTAECSRSVSLDIGLRNIGSNDEEVDLSITSAELDIDETKSFELNDGTDDDTEYERTLIFNIGEDITAGTYPIYIEAKYDDESETETVYLRVKDCIKIIEKENRVKVETIPTQEVIPSTPQTAQIPPKKVLFENTRGYLVLLAIISVILVILLLHMIGVAIRSSRR